MRLILEQFALSTRVSSMNTVGVVTRALSLQTRSFSWLIYLLAAGVLGWLIALIVRRDYPRSYLSSGILLGLIIWGAMNLLFSLTRLAVPTWSRTAGTLITDIATHLVLGITIAYALWRTRLRVRGEDKAAVGPS